MLDSEHQASLDWDIADVIQLLAKHLSEDEKLAALDRAQSLATPSAKVGALVGVADTLSAPLRDSVREDALQIARSIEKPWYRFRAMSDVLYVSDESQKKDILDELLSLLSDIPGEGHRRRSLFLIAGFLSDNLADRAVQLARSFEDAGIRVQSLAKLSGHLSNKEKLEVMDELQALYEDETGQSLVTSLLNLVKNLPIESKPQILNHVDHVAKRTARIQLLTNLIDHFPDQREDFLRQLDELVVNDRGEPSYFWNLIVVAGVAPEPQRSQLIKSAEGLAQQLEGQFKVQYLAQVARYLDADEKANVVDDAIESARSIEDPITRAKSMGILMSVSPDNLRSSLAAEAWKSLAG